MSYGYRGGYRRRRRSRGLARMIWALVLLAGLGLVASVVQSVLGGGSTGASPTFPGLGNLEPGDQNGDEPGLDLPAGTADVLQRNRFYQAGSPGAVECPAPRLTSASAGAQREYDEQVFGCLNRAWDSVLARSDHSTADPGLFVFSETGTSPCGTFQPATGRILAFYCSANRTMYADAEQMARTFPARDHVVYALVLAHEYGHHLQNVSGILRAESTLAYNRPAQANELSRRTEVQASCLAGVFIRAIEESYPVQGNQRSAFEFYAFRAFGDSQDAAEEDRTHGTSRSQGEWIGRGFNGNETGACNSFTAPASSVE